jgi:hypothetical protein
MVIPIAFIIPAIVSIIIFLKAILSFFKFVPPMDTYLNGILLSAFYIMAAVIFTAAF